MMSFLRFNKTFRVTKRILLCFEILCRLSSLKHILEMKVLLRDDSNEELKFKSLISKNRQFLTLVSLINCAIYFYIRNHFVGKTFKNRKIGASQSFFELLMDRKCENVSRYNTTSKLFSLNQQITHFLYSLIQTFSEDYRRIYYCDLIPHPIHARINSHFSSLIYITS